jgi:hypothetical protein
MMRDDAERAVQSAERIIWAAGWRMQEDEVLRQLAGTIGLARGRLEPRSDVIQLVTYDGQHLGHVRRDSSAGPERAWVAVPKGRTRLRHQYASAPAAAAALAEFAGKMQPRS